MKRCWDGSIRRKREIDALRLDRQKGQTRGAAETLPLLFLSVYDKVSVLCFDA